MSVPFTLAHRLRHEIIPRAQQPGHELRIIARPHMTKADIPSSVRLTQRSLCGERIVVKNRRYYGNIRNFKAHWPQAGLDEREVYSALYVLNGHADIQIGRYAVQCGEGTFLLIPPGTPQPDGIRLRFHAPGSTCNILTVILHPHAIQCFITHSRPDQERVRFQENYLFENHRLALLFQLMAEEMMEAENPSNDTAASLLYAFWTILQREVDQTHYINPGPIGRPSSPQHHAGFEAELLAYIQAHLQQSLTLEDVARGLYLSRTEFIRRMRRETGKTFIQYLTDYRMEEAKLLLRDSNWTINAITGFLGYKSQAYFQAVFRRNIGLTPQKYRENLRKDLPSHL